MNCKNFYGSKRPGRERIDVNQGIHNPVDSIYEDIHVSENYLSDLSDYSNDEDPEATAVVAVKSM